MDLTERTITDAVIDTMAATRDARLRELLRALILHLPATSGRWRR